MADLTDYAEYAAASGTVHATSVYGDRTVADLCEKCGTRIQRGHTLCGRCSHEREWAPDDAADLAQKLANHRAYEHHLHVQSMISAWCTAAGLPATREEAGVVGTTDNVDTRKSR